MTPAGNLFSGVSNLSFQRGRHRGKTVPGQIGLTAESSAAETARTPGRRESCSSRAAAPGRMLLTDRRDLTVSPPTAMSTGGRRAPWASADRRGRVRCDAGRPLTQRPMVTTVMSSARGTDCRPQLRQIALAVDMPPLCLDVGKTGCGHFRNDRVRRPEIGEIALFASGKSAQYRQSSDPCRHICRTRTCRHGALVLMSG
jgi:hypothetical protein